MNYLSMIGTGAFFSACERENTSHAVALASAYLRTAANIKEMKEKKYYPNAIQNKTVIMHEGKRVSPQFKIIPSNLALRTEVSISVLSLDTNLS